MTVPSLPPIVTFGKDRAEALAMAEDAIRLYVSYLVDLGEEVPAEAAPLSVEQERVAA